MNRTTLMGLVLLLSLSFIVFAHGFICQCHQHQNVVPAQPAAASMALSSVAATQPSLQATLVIHLSLSSPPAQPTMMYSVKRGDRLWTIAETVYGTGNGKEWRRIAQANHIDHPNHIYPGGVLIIPPLYP
jgi:5'-nucleotidase / UDP-sugar diphosphatase